MNKVFRTKIRSKTDARKKYVVVFRRGAKKWPWTCNCLHWINRHGRDDRFECKHIDEAKSMKRAA
jgi:hypothetical protein